MTHRASTFRWFLLVVWLLAAILFPTTADADTHEAQSPAGIGVRLLDAPAASADDLRARLYIVDHLAPGAVIERRIEVTNTTDASAAIRIYAAGASITNGTFVGHAGDSPNELWRWNTVRPDHLELDAGSHATVAVTIIVPRDASPGERYAAVWAEVRSGEANGSGVEQVNRVGIRQYLSVGPGGPPPVGFTIDSLTASRTADGAPLVVATVHNTGGRALDMAGELELLDGPGGLHAGPFPASLGSSLAIGDSAQVAIPLDEQVPDGPWEAVITLRSGVLEHAVKATLTFPHAGSATPVPITPDDGSWSLPLVTGLLLILLCVGLFSSLARRRRTGPANDRPEGDSQVTAGIGSRRFAS